MPHDEPSRPGTQTYDYVWRTFERYCGLVGKSSLPAGPETVRDFLLAERERLALPTLRHTLRSIALRHRAAGHPDPTRGDEVQTVIGAIEEDDLLKLDSTPRVDIADPVPHPDVLRMAEALGDSPLDLRDRALLLIGAAARLSKAALVSLRFGGIREAEEHVDLVVRDRGSERVYRLPRVRGLPDLSAAVEAWASAAGITSGPVFRSLGRWGNVSEKAMSPQAVGKVLKKAAEQAGLPPGRASADIFAERPEQ